MSGPPVIYGEVLFDCFENGQRVLGGAPFNVAWHLQALGSAPLFVSRVGNDRMGREIQAAMRHWGMSTAGIQIDHAHPTGEVRVTLRGGQPEFDILPDRAYDHIDPVAIPPLSPPLIYHGSLILRNRVSARALDHLIERYQAPVFMDVNLRPPWWRRETMDQVLDRARWVKVSSSELEALVGGDATLGEKAKKLMARHDLEWLIVTLGDQGLLSLDDTGALHKQSPATTMEVVDSVGAGDAFTAVCILGLFNGWPRALTLERAQRLASAVLGLRGAITDDAAFYQPFIDAWELAPPEGVPGE
ncbi:MAG TPA: carbohydrate kinase [Sedimenticola sp.]|nr:carbohydrate kinase [Sedimenticola sp.]